MTNSKYVTTEEDIFSIFALPSWKLEGIATYPANYASSEHDAEYIRISIIPGSQGINAYSVEGIVMIDIFTAYGYGDRRSLEIADTLDTFLVNKTFSTNGKTTQIFESTLKSASNADDTTLDRKIFTIPFKHFGVN